MLKVTKRTGSPFWWISGTVNGRRVRQSSGTEDEQAANEYRATLEVSIWRETRLGERRRYRWQEAVIRWLKDKQRDGKSIDDDVGRLRWLDPILRDRWLDEIDLKCIMELKQRKIDAGATNGTVNRMLALVRAVLRKAVNEWDMIERAPAVKLLKEPKIRIRWLTQEEARRLLAELPPHLSAMAEFSLATGLRASNVTGLEWSQVDLARRVAWIHPDQAKAGKAIPVPLNDMAVNVLRRVFRSGATWVFTYKDEPIIQPSGAAWRKALKRAGISEFRWHDLRHTWASWHVQNGTSLVELQQLGGWSSYAMVLRYAHLAPETLANAASNIGTLLTHSETRTKLIAA
jgi:integrase